MARAAPNSVDPERAEDAYCEARARRYIGDERVRRISDYELESWIKAERAEARVSTVPDPEAHLADVPELVAKARFVVELWRAYSSPDVYGPMLRHEMDAMDLDVLIEAMAELGAALAPFPGASRPR